MPKAWSSDGGRSQTLPVVMIRGNIIHITMAKHASQGYFNAKDAARSFENVTVVDSPIPAPLTTIRLLRREMMGCSSRASQMVLIRLLRAAKGGFCP